MPEFKTVEDTLFVPMLGRIYASENYPQILKDEKALELKDKLPKSIKGEDTQTQYTLLASAVRSVNMDRYIQDFMHKNADGVIAMLGAGLETTFYRNDDRRHIFYEIDLPEVIDYRREVLSEVENDRYIAGDGFATDWIEKIREEFPTEPILVVASGLFYYFTDEKVKTLFRTLKNYGEIEVVFDTVNKSGMKRMSKYMKQVGHSDAEMFFFVNSGTDLAEQVGGELLYEEPYYAHTCKKGLKFSTSLTMKLSDFFKMVKMVHLKLN